MKSPAGFAFAAATLLLAGCVSTGPTSPTFQVDAGAADQAEGFIKAERMQHLEEVSRVAITACNVMFAQTSSAHASTGGGIFSTAGGYRRAEAKVSTYYTLVGMGESDLQRMTDDICADAQEKLAEAGYEVVPMDELRAHPAFRALHESGRKTPFEHKQAAGGGQSVYRVFTPAGYSVYDERYAGGGLGQAFAAAGGNASWQKETRVLDELGISGVNLNLLVDFARVSSSGQASGGMLASRNRASVGGEVDLAVTGELVFMPHGKLNCWDRFGKRECELRHPLRPTLTSRAPVTTRERFHEQVTDATTSADKATAVITKGLAIISALGGSGGGFSQDTTRYNVVVEPGRFSAAGRRGIDGFIDMALAAAGR